MRNWSMVIGGVVLGAALIAGCGGGSAAPAASGGASGATVTATLKDLTLTIDKTTAKAGDVTFKAVNQGALVHELVVIKTDLAPDKLPQKDGKADENAGTVVGEIAEFPGGKTETKTFKLEAGKYLLLCNVAGHYAAGMTTAFTVQ